MALVVMMFHLFWDASVTKVGGYDGQGGQDGGTTTKPARGLLATIKRQPPHPFSVTTPPSPIRRSLWGNSIMQMNGYGTV